jgi:hypothetical protein
LLHRRAVVDLIGAIDFSLVEELTLAQTENCRERG